MADMGVLSTLAALLQGGQLPVVRPAAQGGSIGVPLPRPNPMRVEPRQTGVQAERARNGAPPVRGQSQNVDAPSSTSVPSIAPPTASGNGAGLLSGVKIPSLSGGTDLGSALRSVAAGMTNADPRADDLGQAASAFLGSSTANETFRGRNDLNAAIDASDLSDAEKALAKSNPQAAAALLVPKDPVLGEIRRPDGLMQKAWFRPGKEPSPVGAPYEAKDVNTTADIQEFQYARDQGFQGSLADWKRLTASPSTSIKIGDDANARAELARQYGMDPASPEGRAFILTGKMPREDQQPLTATDKKAILEADEMVAANKNVISALDEATTLSPKANEGWGAGARAAIGNNLPDWMVPDFVASPESSQATAELDNAVVSQALAQLKTIFGGNPTEGERKILLDLQGSSSQPDKVRQAIFKRAKEAAQRRLTFNEQRAAELRGNEYYKPGGGAPSTPDAPDDPALPETDADGWRNLGGGVRMKQVQ